MLPNMSIHWIANADALPTGDFTFMPQMMNQDG